MSQKILTLLLFLAALKCGTAVKCYHCYDLYNGNAVTFADPSLDDKLVKCSQKQKDWNSWECPPDWPVCLIMSLTSKNIHEVVRTCAVKDFCSLYVPLNGITLEYCRECDTALCNDFTSFPVPSNNSEFLFTFNINLHKKLPTPHSNEVFQQLINYIRGIKTGYMPIINFHWKLIRRY